MSYVRVGKAAAFKGVLSLPRVGAWHADLDLDADEKVEGAVSIDIGGALVLRGTVHSGSHYHGWSHVRIVGGADGLARTATPRHYVGPTFRAPLTDLVAAAGERLSPSIEPGTLSKTLPAWTIRGVSIGLQLSALVSVAAAPGSVWRVLTDGSIWVGRDTFPESGVEEWRETGRSVRDGRVEVGLDAPLLLPGTTLGDDRIDYVEESFDGEGVSARVWLAP